MSDLRRKAMLGSVDRMLSSLDDMDADRLRSLKSPPRAEGDDNSGEYAAEAMGGDGDTMGDMGSGEPSPDMDDDADLQQLRDAAAAGDSNARRILEVIDAVEEPGNEMAGGDLEEESAALDKSDSDADTTSQSDDSADGGWSQGEEVQDGVGMYQKLGTKRRLR